MLRASAIKNCFGIEYTKSLAARQISQSLFSLNSDSTTEKCAPWIKYTFDGVASHEARFRLEQGCFVYDSGMKKEALGIIRSTMDNCKTSLTQDQQWRLSPIALFFADKALAVDRKASCDLLAYAATFSQHAAHTHTVRSDETDIISLYCSVMVTEDSMESFSKFPSLFPVLSHFLGNIGQGASELAKKTRSNTWADICLRAQAQNATALLWRNLTKESKEALDDANSIGQSLSADHGLRALALSKLGTTLTKMAQYEAAQESFESSLEFNKINPESFLLPPQPKDMTSSYYRDLYVAIQTLTGLGEKALAEEKVDFAEKYFTFSLKGIENLTSANSPAKYLIAAQAQNLHGLARAYTIQRNPIISEGLYRNAIQLYENAYSPVDWRLLPLLRDFASMLKASSRRSTALIEKRIQELEISTKEL